MAGPRLAGGRRCAEAAISPASSHGSFAAMSVVDEWPLSGRRKRRRAQIDGVNPAYSLATA